MEVALILILFLSNAFGLDCLYNRRYKTTGALLILNMCLTVALAYQFGQMQNIMYVLLAAVGIIVVVLIVRYILLKKKKEGNIIDTEYIEEKEDDV
ncbi:MAG: hypothetical protein LUG60_10210 [Erysipelotrichaceae bacterium]|nr:hypothetical protein [Erysipelotrichaceae bacterium]